MGSQNLAAASEIVSIMQTSPRFRSSIYHGLFNLTIEKYPYFAKLRSTSSLLLLLANGRVLIKVLLNFLLPIPLDEKKGGNRGAFGKKASSKAVFLILLLHNFSEDVFLFLLLHPLIVSFSLYLLIAKLVVSVFGKDNAGKSMGDDSRSIGTNADRGIKVDDPGIKIDADARINDLGTATDNLGIAADNLGIVIDNLDTTGDDLGIIADNQGIVADDPGTRMDTDAGADNPNTAASNKACAAFLFALHYALFLLASSSKLVITSLLFFSLSPSSTILWSKLILSYLVILVKQRVSSSKYPMDEI